MKEVTTITTVELTNITLINDEDLEEALAENNDLEARKNVEQWLKQTLGLDKVDIKDVKFFVADHKSKIKCEDTGEIFDSVKDAGIKYGLNRGNIKACCEGKRKSCGGKKWSYVEV